MKAHRFTVRGVLLSLNAERKGGKMTRASAAKQWRTDAYFEAKAAHLPHLERVSIVVQPHQHSHRLADAGNHIPSVKSVVDGLVDAGVLDDDGPKFVSSLTLLAPRRTTGHDRLDLELVEVTGDGF